MRGIQIGREEAKLSLYADDTYMGNLQSMQSQRVGHNWSTEQQQQRLYTKTTRNDKWIQQGSRIQDWHTEICCISLH